MLIKLQFLNVTKWCRYTDPVKLSIFPHWFFFYLLVTLFHPIISFSPSLLPLLSLHINSHSLPRINITLPSHPFAHSSSIQAICLPPRSIPLPPPPPPPPLFLNHDFFFLHPLGPLLLSRLF